jgi:DNA-binding transcriptional ArsR family regulator
VRLRGVDLCPLAALIRPEGYVPDFITPGVAGLSLQDELDYVRATDVAQVRAELEDLDDDPIAAVVGPRIRRLRDRYKENPDLAVSEVVTALGEYWRAGLADKWSSVRHRLWADIELHTQMIGTAGFAAMFGGLHRSVSWQESGITVDMRYSYEVDLSGRGLLLIPSAFSPDQPLTMLPPVGSAIIYPARLTPHEVSERQARKDPLATLIGAGRAAVLRALERPKATGQLAAELGVTASAISQHTKVLRDAGLLVSWREGRSVLHNCSRVGLQLLDSTRG